MPALTKFLSNDVADSFPQLVDAQQTAGYRSPVLGWVVGTTASGTALLDATAGEVSGTWSPTFGFPRATDQPGSGNALRWDEPLSGDFASGNWVLSFVVRANSNGGAQDGNVRVRLWKGPNADGSGSTEITSAVAAGTTVTNVSTSADFTSTVTFNPGAFSLENEYLFVVIAWNISGAGGMAQSDINIRIGTSSNGTRITTADFTESAVARTGSGSATIAAATATGTGETTATASGAATVAGATSNGSGTCHVAGAGASTIAAATSSGTGSLSAQEERTGDGTAIVSPITSGGGGSVDISASGSANAAAITSDGVGSASTTASGSAGLSFDASGDGATNVSGAGSATSSAAVSDGEGDLVAGAVGSASAPIATGSGAATATISGAGDATIAPAASSGIGNTSDEPVSTGGGAAVMAPMTTTGSGAVEIVAAGSASIAPMIANGAVAVVAVGAGSAAIAACSSFGMGSVDEGELQPITGEGSSTIGACTGTGAATVGVTGAGSATCAAFVASTPAAIPPGTPIGRLVHLGARSGEFIEPTRDRTGTILNLRRRGALKEA